MEIDSPGNSTAVFIETDKQLEWQISPGKSPHFVEVRCTVIMAGNKFEF